MSKAMKQYVSTAAWVGTLTAIFSTAAHADVYCSEQITQVIVNSSGGVYFTTNETCPNWCQLNFSTSDAVKQGYAMLLAANAQGKTLMFEWGNLTSCSTPNSVYASPANVVLGQ